MYRLQKSAVLCRAAWSGHWQACCAGTSIAVRHEERPWYRSTPRLHHSRRQYNGFRKSEAANPKTVTSESNNVLARINLLNLNDDKTQGVARLIDAYRNHGHRRAKINPLVTLHRERNEILELNPENYGLQMDATVVLEGSSVLVSDLVKDLERLYCGTISIETSQLNTTMEKEFICQAFARAKEETPSDEERREAAELLIESEAVDHFCNVKFKTLKRYGGEGAETAAVFAGEVFRLAAAEGLKEIVLGMPHRGRQNLLLTQLNYPPEVVFRKIQGLSEFPDDALHVATGDVLSHLTSSTDLELPGGKLHVTMVPCPSHLEAVNPVAMGKCRGRQQTLGEGDYCEDGSSRSGDTVLCFLMHGDAAFAGQGVVSECFNMSNLPHFSIGGTVHLIVNNQLGFTTPSERGRSSEYASDIGKMVGCPVIRVNGDYPEDLIRAAQIAMEYRKMFRKDIIIDMLCFRRWGHNEMDDPSFTQPRMYEEIEAKTSVPEKYAQGLVDAGLLTSDDISSWKQEVQTRLGECLKNCESHQPAPTYLQGAWSSMGVADPEKLTKWETGYPVENLRYIGMKSVEIPDHVKMHERLVKMYAEVRKQRMTTVEPVDWATAETLAFGSLLQQDYNVRICGQDVGRGTFSHRHAIVVCQDSENIHIPLNHIDDGQKGRIEVVNSLLSEEAVLGFEYGMSVENPNRLVIWEAQFGDFFTGAQIIFDTFVNSGEAKWMMQSGLVVLLPHGYDGMGPEHSSCRIERFLQATNSREDGIDGDGVNIHFCNPTTPAQYFHLLRRQMVRKHRKPLIIASPKTLLRLPAASSHLADMGTGTSFHPVLGDPSVTDLSKVVKVLFCSGKHYYALADEREKLGLQNTVGIIRVEELCPFPTDALRSEVSALPNVKTFVWAQEEPRNMGAWSFVAPRFENKLGIKLSYAGRPVLPAPAVGIGKIHQQQVKQILVDAFK